MKLCFFGDSIGKGIVYDKERGRYVPTENSFVRLVGEEEKIDIENFSRFGCTVTRGEQIVERNVPEIKSSDYVVLEFGGNDSDYNWKKIADDPDAEHSPNTPLSVFVETYKKVIGEIKKLGKIPVILNLPPVDARKYFRWVSNGVNGDNIMKWLGGDEIYIYRWHEMYNAAICDLSNSMKIPMIDIRSAFLVKRDYSDYLCEDGIHPNERGHKLIKDTLVDAIKDVLPGRTAAEQLSREVLAVNSYIQAHTGYSLYNAQLAVAEAVKRKLLVSKFAFIVAECGAGKSVRRS